MHKKILYAILAFCLFISSLPVMTSASANADRDLHLVTSYCPDNYLDLRIKGEKLIVTGVLSTGFDSPFWAIMRVSSKNSFYTDEAEYVNITPGKTFSTEISLSSVTEPVRFVVYTSSERYGTYWSYIWHSIYIEPDGAGGYRFQTSPVLENNLEKESYWINPGRYLGSKSSQSNSADYLTGYLNNNLDEETSKKIQALSDEIVQGAKSEYEKVFLLYKWVVENIYYDYDAYYGTSSINTSVSSILDNRRSVCEGYANMLQALIQAQGIPCIKVSTYSLGISTTGKWTDSYIATNSSNHAHNEAFVDGRWIAMDATWDSNNRYENGKYEKRDANCYLYFDITPEVLASDHKIISRPKASEEDTPSSWAQKEVFSAICEGLVPAALQGSYRESITREEFCTLIMNMLCRKNDMNLHEYLKSKKIKLNPNTFTDTSNEYILAANALGIVSGRGNKLFDPRAHITRQEAAAMLACAAKAAGIISPNSEAVFFVDSDKFGSWAADSIAFITALSGSSGTRVMGGTGNNRFSPLDTYTREQSIMSVLRLYECM